jgi:hypothetical protein
MTETRLCSPVGGYDELHSADHSSSLGLSDMLQGPEFEIVQRRSVCEEKVTYSG